jgi:pimeloyl-ACP methyl ester carboxylesterase
VNASQDTPQHTSARGTVELGYIAVGDGPTLVALHGGLLDGRLTFGPVLADWARHFRVLVPDRRGFPHSPGPDGTIAEQARDLEAFIDTHAGGRAHVLGFSFGGVVALTALQLERRLFSSLTVVEAPAVTLCGGDREALELRIWLGQLYDAAVDGDAALRDFFEVVDPRALGRIDALAAAGDPGLHVALDELRVWRTPLSPAGLAGSRVPTLVVTGERSPRSLRAVGRRVAEVTGGRHHVLASAGHAAHLAGPPFRELLRAHIATADA